MLSSKVKNIWHSSVVRITDTISLSLNNSSNNQIGARKRIQRRNRLSEPTIVFVMPLAGRFQTFLRFLKNYEHVCLKHPETMSELLVVLFEETNSTAKPFYSEIEKLRRKYLNSNMNIITVQGNFSRGVALNEATHSDHIQMDDIMFFIDVDIVFKRTSIDRIRMNTKMHKQVYSPIVFSQYNPTVWSKLNDADPNRFDETKEASLSYNSGYFRQFGYGICAIYKSDVLHPKINGFDNDITGWGLEDVRFLERIVKLNQTPLMAALKNVPETMANVNLEQKSTASLSNNAAEVPLKLKIFRASDPTLVHIYHDIRCDKSLSETQYAMCLGTMASTLGSYKYIESIFMHNQTIIDFIRNENSIR